MNKHELRTGNLVTQEGDSTVFKLVEIGFDCILCEQSKNPLNEKTLPTCAVMDLAEIPLNADWFKRLGFDSPSENDNCIGLPNGDASELNIELDLYDENKYNICLIRGQHKGIPGKDYNYVYAGSIKYVHELQNLYFALTGEELKTSK